MTSPSNVEVWSRASWQAEALAWASDRLDDHGIQRTGVDPTPRIRTWAAVFRIPTDHGAVWFKAASAITAHEISLYPLLVAAVPDTVLTPLAVDPDRGWLLLPDGGPSLMHAVPPGELIGKLQDILPRYARLQIALAPHVDAMLNAGVPDMRSAVMPERFDEAIAAVRALAQRFPEPGDDDLFGRIAAFRPEYVAMCETLANSPFPPSLDHGDLHSNNILPDVDGTPRIYDWGDSAIAHPFSTMLGLLRFVANRLGVHETDPLLDCLRDAYLSVFAGDHSPDAMRATMEAASRVAMVSRALTYARLMELGPLHDPSWNRAAISWMSSLLEP